MDIGLGIGWGLVVASASAIAWGLPLVSILCPACTNAERTCLVFSIGYVVTILLRFVLAWLGLLDAFWLGAFLFFGIWLAARAFDRRVAVSERYSRALTYAVNTLTKPTVYVVGIILLLSIWAVSPLLTPLHQTGAGNWLDFAHRDAHYHLIRAVILEQGIPQYTNPDFAGTTPILYPDFNHAWMGMLLRATNLDARAIYFQVAPIFLIFATILNLFAVGKTWTHRNLGGYVGAALAYLVFVPNPWDPNLLLRQTQVLAHTLYETHFYDLQYNLAITAGMLLFSSLVLVLLAFRQQQDTRTRIGLLTVGSVLVVGLARVRSNYFVPIAPLYISYLLWLCLHYKQWKFLVPLLAFGVLIVFVAVESYSGAYEPTGAQLTLEYGRYGMALADSFPTWVSSTIAHAPQFLQPLLIQSLWIATFSFGLFYLLLCLVSCFFYVRVRPRLSFAALFPLLTLLGAFVAASVIVLAHTEIKNGNWGGQMFSLLPRVAVLVGIVPLYKIVDRLASRTTFFPKYNFVLALGLVLLCTFMTYRAANAALHRLPQRAYPITQQEFTVYSWVRVNAARDAVIAAHPEHRVNPAGETIRGTNFLSGVTERPAYMQRLLDAAGPRNQEGQAREKLLKQLFEAQTPHQVQLLLVQMNFDYLLVYADKPPQTDLSCCLERIFDGKTKLYFKSSR